MIRYSYYAIFFGGLFLIIELSRAVPVLVGQYRTIDLLYFFVPAMILFPNTYALWRSGRFDIRQLIIGFGAWLSVSTYLVAANQGGYLGPLVVAAYLALAVWTIWMFRRSGLRGLQVFLLPILSIWLFPPLVSLAVKGSSSRNEAS